MLTFSIMLPEEVCKLDEKSRVFLVETLQDFCSKAVKKFCKGQLEHGGVIYERPMLSELENEQIDSMFYLAGAKKRLEDGEKVL